MSENIDGAPSIDDVIAAMEAATVARCSARVAAPDEPSTDDEPTRLARALHELLGAFALRVEAAETLTRRFRLLSEASLEFSSAMYDPSQLMAAIARRLGEVAGDTCAVLLVSEDDRSLVLAAAHPPDETTRRCVRETFGAQLFFANNATVRRVHEGGEPRVLEGVELENFVSETASSAVDRSNAAGLHSLLVVPLRARGQALGQALLARFGSSMRPFDEDDLALTMSLAAHASLAFANARAYENRRAAAASFLQLARSGIIGILVSNLDGRVIEVNKALSDLVGYSREEIVSGAIRWADLTPPEWAPVDQRAIRELRESSVASLHEKEYVRKDGTRAPVLAGSAVLEGTSGACISFVLDLRANDGLKAAIDHLREARASEANFRTFVEAAPDAVVIVNAQGNIVLVNSRTEKLFGYVRDDLLGQSVDILVPAPLRGRHAARRDAYVADPDVRSMGPGLELYGVRRDGTEFPVEITLSPLLTAQGTLVSSSIRDITERKKAEEQRLRSGRYGRRLGRRDHRQDAGRHRHELERRRQSPVRLLCRGDGRAVHLAPGPGRPPGRRAGDPEAPGERTRRALRHRPSCDKDGQEIDVSVTSSPVRDSTRRT